MTFVLALFTLFGHGFLWIGLANRLHALAISRKIIDFLTTVFFSIMGAGPIVLLIWWLAGWENPFEKFGEGILVRPGKLLLDFYFAVCWIVGGCTLARWLWHNLYFRRPPAILRLNRRQRASISPERAAVHPQELAHHRTALLPGNEILQLDVAEREFDVPRLSAALDGLKILQLSDIHFTDKVGKAYFREVVRVGNELKPDLIALTGDFADNNDCIDWIPETLGQLSAPHGVYFILGNHDTYIDTRRVRETLKSCGPIDLGGRWLRVEIDGQPIVLAGNELPWISPAADFRDCGPTSANGGPLRIVLGHSPDQLGWARANGVDLMLSGHTHGGQIRLPLVGPILTPCLHGVKFDNGLFHLPPTILHLTRGVSGKTPLRWNCRPEIALLTLRAANK
jgi:predicted MPP superfamily phosphohydrolase